MKKILFSVLMLFMASAFIYGQQDITKFLGIPVDGSKSKMKKKLKEKGFVSIAGSDMLEGEFNGTQVYVSVVTNSNKVWRIGLSDKTSVGETDIKIRFNNLCQQFENNDNYLGLPNQSIADDEDISYEITTRVRDKKVRKKLVISPVFCIFIVDNQNITRQTSDDSQRQSYRDFLYYR